MVNMVMSKHKKSSKYFPYKITFPSNFLDAPLWWRHDVNCRLIMSTTLITEYTVIQIYWQQEGEGDRTLPTIVWFHGLHGKQ